MIALFFDTETTGIPTAEDPDFKPRLVQLAAVLQDIESGRILAEINLIANQYPGELIPVHTTEIHGITNKMTVDYGLDPKLIDIVFGKLVKMCDIMVAHNIEYDLSVIKHNLPLTQSVVDFKHHFCTLVNNLYIVRKPLSDPPKLYYGMTSIPADARFEPPSLKSTYQFYFNDDFENAHDAMSDARAVRDIFLKMIVDDWYKIAPDAEFGVDQVMPTDKFTGVVS